MKAPSRITRRKIRILQSELQMLQHYSSEISLLFDDYKIEYHKDLSYFREKASDISLPIEEAQSDSKSILIVEEPVEKQKFTHDEPDIKSVSDTLSEKPEWAKKLFRKIALMTHPDRILNDEDLRQKMERIFLKAGKALESGNMDDLIEALMAHEREERKKRALLVL